MLEDESTAVRGLIGTGIVCSVLDGIAINQRNLIVSRSGDDITVGGVAGYASALGGEVVGTAG